MEEWKSIPNYPNYEVSNSGKVRYSYSKKLVRIKYSTKGYAQVNLYKDDRPKTQTVHRLVAQLFIPNPEGKKYVNHINGDKTDNSIANLEWMTMAENQQHAVQNSLRKVAPYYSEETLKLVKKLYEEGVPVRKIMEQTGMSKSNVYNVLKRKIET